MLAESCLEGLSLGVGPGDVWSGLGRRFLVLFDLRLGGMSIGNVFIYVGK